MAGFEERGNHVVETDTVEPVGQECDMCARNGAGRRMAIPFDTGDLHEPGDRVAGKAQMMFEPHFRGVFDLSCRSAEELGCRCRSHGAGGPDFSLATDRGT